MAHKDERQESLEVDAAPAPHTMPVFRWDGEYWGFLAEGHLYSPDGRYLGWVDEKKHVWLEDGAFLGYLKHENYILRNVHREELTPRWPKKPPPPLDPAHVPAPKQKRPPKPPLHGWTDALGEEQQDDGTDAP